MHCAKYGRRGWEVYIGTGSGWTSERMASESRELQISDSPPERVTTLGDQL